MMAKKDLKREPHNLGENVWWYEENAGIEIYIRKRRGLNEFSPVQKHLIPWRIIRAALKRKDT